MKAGKAPTPASKDSRGLVPQGRVNCGKDSPEAGLPGFLLFLVPMTLIESPPALEHDLSVSSKIAGDSSSGAE